MCLFCRVKKSFIANAAFDLASMFGILIPPFLWSGISFLQLMVLDRRGTIEIYV